MGRRESHKKTGLKDYGAKFNQPILGRKGEVAPRTLFMERATQAPLIEKAHGILQVKETMSLLFIRDTSELKLLLFERHLRQRPCGYYQRQPTG